MPPASPDPALEPIEANSVGQPPTLANTSRDDRGSRELWRATVDAIWPWSKKLYRGYSVTAGEALGYQPATIRRWRGLHAPVSHAASLRIIALLERQLATLGELLHAWRAYAADRARIDATTTPGFRFRSFTATERSGWRSKPRIPHKGGR
jgi:hypothetical protein